MNSGIGWKKIERSPKKEKLCVRLPNGKCYGRLCGECIYLKQNDMNKYGEYWCAEDENTIQPQKLLPITTNTTIPSRLIILLSWDAALLWFFIFLSWSYDNQSVTIETTRYWVKSMPRFLKIFFYWCQQVDVLCAIMEDF